MRYASLLFVILFGLLVTTLNAQADQLKTGIMKSAPSPNQISSTPKPTPQVPDVKTAPGVTAPVPTKQGITAPLGQKTTIAVKSPAQGTQHPAGKPLPIVWDRSTIPAAATVNILLVDKPGGTAKATIKAGTPNTGSFTSWIAPQQYTAAGNSWAIRIETADSKASGHSGVFSFQPAASSMVSAQKTFDRSGITTQMKMTLESKIKQFLAVHQFNPSTETRLKICQQQNDSLKNALVQCLKTNSNPVNPPPGSPLDSFNKLTNAQLAQKCPGSLQQCLDKVMDEHIAWCRANICSSQSEAFTAKRDECSQLEVILDQEKYNSPCWPLQEEYLNAERNLKNCHPSDIFCQKEWKDAKKDALKKLQENGCPLPE